MKNREYKELAQKKKKKKKPAWKGYYFFFFNLLLELLYVLMRLPIFLFGFSNHSVDAVNKEKKSNKNKERQKKKCSVHERVQI